MAKRVSFSKKHLKIDDIVEYKEDLEQSLLFYYSNANNFEKFAFYSLSELNQEKKNKLQELENSCIFMLLSSIEAWIRIDYEYRVKNRLKDELSKELKEIDKTYDKTYKISIDKLCDTYKKYFQGQIFSHIKSSFKLRHWFAHGRYWNPKLGKKYDFDEIYSLAFELNKLLNLNE
jgi:hypothetical protein